ncbi:hypothetical protein JCM19000A_19320 [Silvimonas sp. JCM 19000]
MSTSAALTHWDLVWPHGSFSVQALGGMLAPVTFYLHDAAGARTVSPLQVAPWQPDPALPGILRSLRGSWPCVPFGMTQPPADLPAAWATHASDSPWDHGFAANHEWQLVARSDSSLTIAIDLPASEPIARLEQCIAVDPDAAAVSVTLLVHARRAVTLPVALHPTFAVPAEGVEVLGCGFSHIETYPVPQEPGVSRIAPNMQAQGLNALPTADGPLDLTRLPLPIKTEELFQLVDCKPPFVLRYPTGTVELEWDSKQLPDALVWISNAGRDHAPWNGRHYAIGVEPANSVFDLARVATPPAEHGLAQRKGIAFSPERVTEITWRLSAR